MWYPQKSCVSVRLPVTFVANSRTTVHSNTILLICLLLFWPLILPTFFCIAINREKLIVMEEGGLVFYKNNFHPPSSSKKPAQCQDHCSCFQLSEVSLDIAVRFFELSFWLLHRVYQVDICVIILYLRLDKTYFYSVFFCMGDISIKTCVVLDKLYTYFIVKCFISLKNKYVVNKQSI